VDGGTLGLDLLRETGEADGLVLVDAVRLGGEPGAVAVLRGEALVAVAGTAGAGPAGAVGELLAVGRLMGWLPEPVALVGVEVAGLEDALRLTPAVRASVPVAIAAVRDELRRMDGRATIDRQGGAATAGMAGATA
jgi:hydrogenase maturation protease